ncbi:hypothetical protein [Methanobacterium sp. ACI-7]|uniref:hypothetical protein n=1 Tax=unclassified Methanobacterium TaxID=2627676 RepID=UPI0039C4DB33
MLSLWAGACCSGWFKRPALAIKAIPPNIKRSASNPNQRPLRLLPPPPAAPLLGALPVSLPAIPLRVSLGAAPLLSSPVPILPLWRACPAS